mgnify:CR=1 FL=1
MSNFGYSHFSTKVIDQTGRHIGSKKTTVLRNAHPSLRNQPPQPKPKPPNANPVFTKRPSPSYGQGHSQGHLQGHSQGHLHSQGHTASPHNPHNPPTTVTSTKPTSPSLNTNTSSLASASANTNSSNNSSKQTGNPAVMSMPYRWVQPFVSVLYLQSYTAVFIYQKCSTSIEYYTPVHLSIHWSENCENGEVIHNQHY